MSEETQNYKLYCSVDNFKSPDKELDFGDFKITAKKQRPEAGDWKRKLHSKNVPQYVLEKSFLNYVMQDDDISGVDNIISSMWDLLACFRLFKIGDIGFSNFLFEDIEDDQGASIGLSNPIGISSPKYSFENSEINKFNEFKTKIINCQNYKSIFYQFPLSYFMRGIERSNFCSERIGAERIIDYFIALESLFLIDGEKCFLRRTIAKRVSNFLFDASLEGKIKDLYDARSKIVHGGYIEENDKKDIKKTDREEVEQIMRRIFLKLLEHNFTTKDEVVQFMKKLYDIPAKALNIVRTANLEAEKLLIS